MRAFKIKSVVLFCLLVVGLTSVGFASSSPSCPYCFSVYVFFSGYSSSSTCTEYETFSYFCQYCGRQFFANGAAPLGHSWEESSRVSATCGASGAIYYKCSRCAERKTETIPQLVTGHIWTETSRRNATCTAAGSVSYKCSVCGSTRSEPLSVLNHTWVETSRKSATCTENGSVGYTCSLCSQTKSTVLSALGGNHTWIEINRTAPACTATIRGQGRAKRKQKNFPKSAPDLGKDE